MMRRHKHIGIFGTHIRRRGGKFDLGATLRKHLTSDNMKKFARVALPALGTAAATAAYKYATAPRRPPIPVNPWGDPWPEPTQYTDYL